MRLEFCVVGVRSHSRKDAVLTFNATISSTNAPISFISNATSTIPYAKLSTEVGISRTSDATSSHYHTISTVANGKLPTNHAILAINTTISTTGNLSSSTLTTYSAVTTTDTAISTYMLPFKAIGFPGFSNAISAKTNALTVNSKTSTYSVTAVLLSNAAISQISSSHDAFPSSNASV